MFGATRNPGQMSFGYKVIIRTDLDVQGSRQGVYDLEFLMRMCGQVDRFPTGPFDQNLLCIRFSNMSKVSALFFVHCFGGKW